MKEKLKNKLMVTINTLKEYAFPFNNKVLNGIWFVMYVVGPTTYMTIGLKAWRTYQAKKKGGKTSEVTVKRPYPDEVYAAYDAA